MNLTRLWVSPRLAVYLEYAVVHIGLRGRIAIAAMLYQIALVAQKLVKPILTYLEAALRQHLCKLSHEASVIRGYYLVVKLDFGSCFHKFLALLLIHQLQT